MKKTILVIILLSLNLMPAIAEEQGQKTVTRAEVIEKLSTADFLKKKIGDLLNWSVGYDITKINRTNLAPTISFIKATPIQVPPDNRTVLRITAKVSDPSGPDNITGVRADLSSIKKLPNTMLVDNGLWGDETAGDQVYTLQTNVGYSVPSGGKEIPVAVANKAGWVALARTNVDVETNPIITDAQAVPQSVPSRTGGIVTFSAKVINPGRQEDIKEVTIDLKAIGVENIVKMWDDGTHGDTSAGDRIFTVIVSVKPGLGTGEKRLPIRAENMIGGRFEGEVTLTVE